MNVQNFLKAYQSLPELRKTILRLKALLYFKMPIENLRKCLYKLNYLFPKQDTLSVQDFNAHIDFLKAQRLIDRDGLLPTALIHSLTVEALDSQYSGEYLRQYGMSSSFVCERVLSARMCVMGKCVRKG